jgi:tetratricopeptide (TPR) repeat protein
MRKETARRDISLIIPFVALVALHLIALLDDGLQLWGIDQWRYVPGAAVIVMLLCGILVLFPAIQKLLAALARRLEFLVPRGKRKNSSRLRFVFPLALAGIIFWLFRNATHFLGDGYVWADHILKKTIFNEPVASWLYQSIFDIANGFRQPYSISPFVVSALISVASGIVFVFFAHKIARILSRDGGQYALVLLALLSCGTVLLFFGYVEPYPPFAASVSALIYFGIERLRGKGSALSVIIAFVVTFLLHPSAIALLPGVVLMFYLSSGRTVSRKTLYSVFTAMVVVGLGALWTLQKTNAFSGFFYDKFLPLFPGPARNRIAYPLFSWQTLVEAANQLLLICPFAVFLLSGIARSPKERRQDTNNILLFLEVCVAFYILEFLVFNKNIGVSRDWDLFAAIAIPLALLTAVLLVDRFYKRTAMFACLTFGIICIHTAPWIALNADRERSEKRFADLVERNLWSDYARGYGYSTLGIYYKQLGDMDRATRYLEATVDADPGNVRYLYNLGTILSQQQRLKEAAEIYERVIERDPDYLEARNNLGVIYWKRGEAYKAAFQFEEVLRINPAYSRSYEPLAHVYHESDNIVGCVRLYELAGRNRVDMTDLFVRLGIETERDGVVKRAAYLLGMLAEADPENTRINVEYAMVLYRAGLRSEALEHLIGLYRSGNREALVLNNIGVFLCQLDHCDKSLEVFEEAVALYPNDPSVRVNYARAFHTMGDNERAREQLTEARRLNARIPEDLREIMDQ